MGSRPGRGRLRTIATVRVLLISVAAAFALLAVRAASGEAAIYQLVLCAGNVGSNAYATATNTTSAQNPGGIFSLENHCGPAPFPAGNGAYMRIVENQSGGNAGYGAYGSISWSTIGWVDILAGGGYTRMPNAFNDGWRGRFWLEGWDGSMNNVLVQGSGVINGDCGGVCWATTSSFGSHLWPFGGFGSYRRFVFEMTCHRQAGCDRANYNAVDANTMVLTLNDSFTPQVGLTSTSPFMNGDWVRGPQTGTYQWNEIGSGMRAERLSIDNVPWHSIDFIAAGQCNRDAWSGVGEYARDFGVCPTGMGVARAFPIDTTAMGDGAHTIKACVEDYGQWVGLAGTHSESCDARTVRTDNTPPGAAPGLEVRSANPERYSDTFAAGFSLPPNSGSPITKVHYDIVNASGTVVVPEKVVGAVNPTELKTIAGPKDPGAYRLRLWLEDAVGFTGAVSVAPIPHDSTPPGAPQEVAVAAPTAPRVSSGFDVTWRNIEDAGSPIASARYQVLDRDGNVVVSTQTVTGTNISSIQDLETPNDRGVFTLKLWLVDGEGNVGAPVSVPLSYGCVKSPAAGGQQLTASLGETGEKTVEQGQGATLSGSLRGVGGDIAGAPVCLFSTVVTDSSADYLGVAVTGSSGSYRFPISAGPSRRLTALYRVGSRELSATATLLTRVHPTLRAVSPVVVNGGTAHFEGEIPGPHNDQVVIVLQVKSGKGWLAFRRYRTRNDGRYDLEYKFRRTTQPTTYEMRAQVRETVGYPYLQGDSDPILLRVVPGKAGARVALRAKRCPKGKRAVRVKVRVKGKKGAKAKAKRRWRCVAPKKKKQQQVRRHRGSAKRG